MDRYQRIFQEGFYGGERGMRHQPYKLNWGERSEEKMLWKDVPAWLEKHGGRLPTLKELNTIKKDFPQRELKF